jgi:hypothetical protein
LRRAPGAPRSARASRCAWSAARGGRAARPRIASKHRTRGYLWHHRIDADDLHQALAEEPRPADERGLRSEREDLDDVGAASDAAVERDFSLVADGVDGARQVAQGRRGRVEVVAAVVGDADRRGTGVDRAPRVVRLRDALHHERPVPKLGQPRDVFPRRERCRHPVHEALDRW